MGRGEGVQTTKLAGLPLPPPSVQRDSRRGTAHLETVIYQGTQYKQKGHSAQ